MNRWITRYLLWFANEHVNFRAEDVRCVASMLNVNIKYITQISTKPYCIVELGGGEKAAQKLASRCVSIRAILELWGHGFTPEELHTNIRETPEEVTRPYFVADKSFRVYVETFCKNITQKEKVDKIETLDYLPIKGPVSLTNPDVRLYLLEYYGLEPNNIPEMPYELFFGRWIADGQRSLITKLALKYRKFLGNTSMDTQLSLLMANQAQIRPGDLVLDPFVGSGSLLVAAAQFGGFVLGGDIDYLMLHGKTRPVRPNQKVRLAEESVKSNLMQYGLEAQYLDVLVADASLPIWRSDLRFNAILTDPPYGIRESTERIGSWRGTAVLPVSEQHIATHIPAKVEYNLCHLLHDLLDFAARHLELGGHLVFWLPVYREDYDPDTSLPQHKCLRLVSNCEQVLNGHSSRRLLTMSKICEPDVVASDSPTTLCNAGTFRLRYFGGTQMPPLEDITISETQKVDI